MFTPENDSTDELQNEREQSKVQMRFPSQIDDPNRNCNSHGGSYHLIIPHLDP